jgi:Replicative DNA helicase
VKSPADTIAEKELPCPSKTCGSSDAYFLYEDGHGHCFSCGYHYFPNKVFEDLTEEFTYEFMDYRGISHATFRKYGAKTKIDSEGRPLSIGYPHRENGTLKVRDLLEKKFYYVGDVKRGCFGVDKFVAGGHKYIVITEGYEDALSVHEVCRVPAVSVQSSGSAAADCAADRAYLNSYERIYLAFDADERGREASSAVAKLFDYSKVYELKFPGGKLKDANDFLQQGQRDDLLNLFHNAKKYLPDTIISSFVDFERIIREVPKVGIPYPFPTLTYMTYGIRTGETVLITAQEGIGKTEVMHAIEHQLLRETKDAIGAIFLEEPKRRHLQALAGIHLQRPVHLPDCGVPDDQVFSAVQKVVGDDDRLHIYSHFGSDDPEHILDTIRFLVSARGCRYILLDHITMVVSGLGGENERRALDYLSTRLEMMVKELDFALILVSHVNDDGLTRGSRNISKICDIRINLHRDVLNSDPIIRRTTNVVVGKNRFCGRTGPAGQLLFDPATYTLKEDTGYDITVANDNSRIEEMAS